jgi:hypothetical protein
MPRSLSGLKGSIRSSIQALSAEMMAVCNCGPVRAPNSSPTIRRSFPHGSSIQQKARANQITVPSLSGSVSTVAGVAKARQNEAMFVKTFIKWPPSCRDIRVQPTNPLTAFGHGDQTGQADILRAAFLQPIDGGECIAGRHPGSSRSNGEEG